MTIAEAIYPYLINRCRSSVHSSLHIVWLLNAFFPETSSTKKSKSFGAKLRNIILSEELRVQSPSVPYHKTHYRSHSDATVSRPNNGSNLHQSIICNHHQGNSLKPNQIVSTSISSRSVLGDLSSGRAFDNGCRCFSETQTSCSFCLPAQVSKQVSLIECHCGAPRIKPEYEFIRCLMNIGKKVLI